MGYDWNMHGRNDDDSYEPPEVLTPSAGAAEEWFGCQDCGEIISFADNTAYVTESGDVYCQECGVRAEEDQAQADAEDGFDFFDEEDDPE